MRSLSGDLVYLKNVNQTVRLSEKIKKETEMLSNRVLGGGLNKTVKEDRAKRQIDKLRFENELKALRIERLKTQVQSLRSMKGNLIEPEITESDLESIEAKCEALRLETQSLTYKKVKISENKIEWKRMLDELTEIFKKLLEQHKNSLFTCDKAVQDSDTTKRKLIVFRAGFETDRENKRRYLLAKQRLKKDLEKDSKIILENISALDEKKRVKKEKIFTVFEKLSKNIESTSRLKETQKQNENILNEIAAVNQLATTLNILPQNFLALVETIIKQYKSLISDLKYNYQTFNRLSETLNDKKHFCENIKNEVEDLKNPQSFQKVSQSEKRLKNESFEIVLLQLYANFHSISFSILAKLNSVYYQCKDPKLHVFIQQLPRTFNLFRSNTLTKNLDSRKGDKAFTINPNFSARALPTLTQKTNSSDLEKNFKFYFHDFKDSESLQHSLLKNKLIQMFFNTKTKINDWEWKIFSDPNDLAKFFYTKSTESLQSNFKTIMNKVVHAISYMKTCVPEGFVAEGKEEVKYRKKVQKHLENRFLVKRMSRGKKKRSSPPRGSFTFRNRVPSGSGSPEMKMHMRMESLKAFKEIDKKMRSLTIKLKLSK